MLAFWKWFSFVSVYVKNFGDTKRGLNGDVYAKEVFMYSQGAIKKRQNQNPAS